MEQLDSAAQNKRQILELFPFSQTLSNSFKQKLIQSAEFASLPAGAFYFEEGQSCSRIALVGSGDIRVFKRGENGREIILYHVERGETCILTASCILAQSPYPATAVVDQAEPRSYHSHRFITSSLNIS